MENIRIAICDDEILLLPHLSAMIRRYFTTQNLECETVPYCTGRKDQAKRQQRSDYLRIS